ncbi:hypothetical protein TNCV_2732511 [Trichonephila clavipes]|nr:hypothetical protein TNCV_2732511 [Trichonephila clavipes]
MQFQTILREIYWLDSERPIRQISAEYQTKTLPRFSAMIGGKRKYSTLRCVLIYIITHGSIHSPTRDGSITSQAYVFVLIVAVYEYDAKVVTCLIRKHLRIGLSRESVALRFEELLNKVASLIIQSILI